MENLHDSFSNVLTETNTMFTRQHATNILGDGIASIYNDDSLFTEYSNALTEGMDPSTQDQIDSLLANSRLETLREASMSGVTPFSVLNAPILVKLWARLTMTQAIPTKPVDVPEFTISTLLPYILGSDGVTKHYLPESIDTMPTGELSGRRKLTAEVAVTGGKLDAYDLLTGLTDIDRKLDKVDRKLSIVGAQWSDSFDIETAAVGPVTFRNNEIINLDTSNSLTGEITYVTDALGTTVVDTILGRVDLDKSQLNLASMSGKLEKIFIRGYLSSEQHTFATQIGLDLKNRQISIGTGEHVEATFPLEYLQDLNAMYNIEGTSTLTEYMSSTVQRRVDLDIIEFLQASYAATNKVFYREFDVTPNSDFALQPMEWRRGLRAVIDHMVQSMRNTFKDYPATFVVVGNPQDTNLLDDINWEIVNGETELNGVEVSYNVGRVSGVAAYKVVSSDLIDEGALKVISIPKRENFKTYEYYPYTFNIVNNYNNSNNVALPNIMMTKRYTMEEFTPIIGEVKIYNNDGSQYR